MKRYPLRSAGASGLVLTLVTLTWAGATPARTETAGSATPGCAHAGAWCGFSAASFRQWDGFDGNAGTSQARRRYFEMRAGSGVYRHYLRALVDGGAVVAGKAGERTLLLLFPDEPTPLFGRFGKTAGYQGSDAWYHTSVRFPASFHPSPATTWNWVVEWHNWPDSPCCANIALTVDSRPIRVRRRHSGGTWLRPSERLSLRVVGGGDLTHPVDLYGDQAAADPLVQTRWFVGDRRLRRNHWYDVLLHVDWSYKPGEGLVRWWLDGRLVASVRMPTLFYYADDNSGLAGATPGPGEAYLEIGYYRPRWLRSGAVDRSVAVVEHAGTRRGPTRAAVAY